MSRLAGYGLQLAALVPFLVCMSLFTDLALWQTIATYAAVGVYAGCVSVIDRRVTR